MIADYGAFVEIAPGVEGLIHVSEMSWTQHLHSAQDFMTVNEEVEAVILTLDRDERKMSLGIKQLKPDPWENIEQKYPVGSTHTATVRNFTNFGAFVEIEDGVEGLIHISDLSWTKKIKHPSEVTEIGAPIEVQVLDIDKENRRLSLGHKQLEENPWDVFETIFTVGSIHEGIIIEMLDKGAVVSLPYGVEGFATPKHLVKEDNSQAQMDEKLDFKVIEFNKDAKRIIVSHSRIHEDLADDSRKKSSKRTGGGRKEGGSDVVAAIPVMEKTTLGDIEELAALKEKLDSQKIEALNKKMKQEEAAKAKAAKAKAKEAKAEEAKAEEAKAEEAKAETQEVKSEVEEVKAEVEEVKMEVTPEVSETIEEVKTEISEVTEAVEEVIAEEPATDDKAETADSEESEKE